MDKAFQAFFRHVKANEKPGYPRFKSCSNCGASFAHLTLADRWVTCDCGLSLDRDHNAAINILKRTGWDTSAVPAPID
ncbi:MAG: transposase [Chloroflexi bacterium]|nr:transposase [Chloroflexota bacterium]